MNLPICIVAIILIFVSLPLIELTGTEAAVLQAAGNTTTGNTTPQSTTRTTTATTTASTPETTVDITSETPSTTEETTKVQTTPSTTAAPTTTAATTPQTSGTTEPTTAAPSSTSSSGSVTSTTISSSDTQLPSTNNNNTQSKSATSGLSTGAIVGIVVGSVTIAASLIIILTIKFSNNSKTKTTFVEWWPSTKPEFSRPNPKMGMAEAPFDNMQERKAGPLPLTPNPYQNSSTAESNRYFYGYKRSGNNSTNDVVLHKLETTSQL